LDPKHVFKDLSIPASGTDKGSSANNAQANVFHPEKKRRHRDGYADGDYTLFKTANVSDFVTGNDAIGILGTVNKLTFQTDEEKEYGASLLSLRRYADVCIRWLKLDITTPEIKAICEDLKVLGKGDFKTLLKWRTALREEVSITFILQPAVEVICLGRP